jgi:hypothetical protein
VEQGEEKWVFVCGVQCQLAPKYNLRVEPDIVTIENHALMCAHQTHLDDGTSWFHPQLVTEPITVYTHDDLMTELIAAIARGSGRYLW